ncbi:MAG TPA: AsmA family protein [Casimicrobiaceae bacterium]|nr:AsmA family protein [Casimicrobiaceae bacterium]
MVQRTKRVVLALAIVAAVLAAFILLFDWNLLKPYAERKVSEITGREFHIQGNLGVKLSLNPLITADRITLANADWSQKQPMVEADQVAFRINLWRLLHRDIDLPEVSVREPHVVLERRADGRKNWVLKNGDEKQGTPPHIGRLTLERGRLTLDDEAPDNHVVLDVTTEHGADAGKLPTRFTASGTIKSLKFSAAGRGGDVFSLADNTTPFPLAGEAQLGTTHAKVEGTITGIAVLSALDVDLDLRGDDLSLLYPTIGLALIPSPPYRLQGRLVHSGQSWEFRKFAGKVGDSDLAGDLTFETREPRSKLSANLTSRVLDMRDLQGFIGPRRGAKPEEPPAEKQQKAANVEAQKDRLLPDQAFRLDRLRAMDADVKFVGQSVRNKDLPFDKVNAHVKVDNGLMTLDPLDFGVAGGTVASHITIDGRKDVPAASAKVDATRLQLPKLLPTVNLTKTSVGAIGGRMDLAGQGKSLGAMLASSNGRLAIAMSSGEISNTLLEVIGLDAGEIMKFLFEGDRNVPLRCGVADFAVKDGVMDAETFVLDTTDTIVRGEGQISVADETMALKFTPVPKDPSIFVLRSPIHIEGTLKHPKVRPDKMLYVRIGAAVALGTLNPLAALIPLIETGPGKDANCTALLASVRPAAERAGQPVAGQSNRRPVAGKRKSPPVASSEKNRVAP